MIVDVNMHWLPENLFTDQALLDSFISIVPRAYGEYAEVTNIPGTDRKQIVISKPKGYENLNFTDMFTDAKGRLEAMDEAGVDKAVLRIPCWQEWLPLEMCRMVNDGLGKSVREHSDRFLGLATVPPWGYEASLEELERCIKELGFSGVVCAAHYGNLYLDEEEFKPYFKKISELGVPVCVHHTPLPVEYGHIYKHTNLRRFLGRRIGQLISLGRILYSGLLEEFPNLRLIHSTLAGGFFAYTNMFAAKKSGVKEDMERFDTASENIRGYLERNIYFDLNSPHVWTKAQLECAVKELGADHILLGSSYPVRREWLLKGAEYVRNLEIGEKEKALILGENAMRLFNIKG